MNVILPEKQRINKRRAMNYIIVLIICIIAIGIAIYQFFADEKLEVILGLVKSENEKIEQLKSEFDGIFKNKIVYIDNYQGNSKITPDEELTYTEYQREEKVDNNYDLNINIPKINIDNNLAKRYNEEIKQIFQTPVENILQTENRNIIYSVNYIANVEKNILSVVILSTFKEGNSAQRTIVKTYNYNLSTNQEVSLSEFMNLKELDKNTVEHSIKKEIQKAQEQTDKLRELGYNIFYRDISDNMYKTENTKEFFMYYGNLYLIYAYGNNNSTSEMDLVIL